MQVSIKVHRTDAILPTLRCRNALLGLSLVVIDSSDVALSLLNSEFSACCLVAMYPILFKKMRWFLRMIRSPKICHWSFRHEIRRIEYQKSFVQPTTIVSIFLRLLLYVKVSHASGPMQVSHPSGPMQVSLHSPFTQGRADAGLSSRKVHKTYLRLCHRLL